MPAARRRVDTSMTDPDRILLDVPEEFETERLVVRMPRAGEGRVMSEAINESHAELAQWFPWAQEEHYSVEAAEAFNRRGRANYLAREDFGVRIWTKDGEFVGSSGLHVRSWDVPAFEIGYWCR